MIRVLVVAEAPLLRHALVSALNGAPDLLAVGDRGPGETTAGPEADVAVVELDAADPDLTPVRDLTGEPGGQPGIVLITDRPARVARCLVAARVQGLVAKDHGVGELIDTVRRVAAGERALDTKRTENPLTAREVCLLRLAAKGGPAADLARELGLTVGTVRNYLSVIFRKTGSHNRLEAIRAAEFAGWL